MTTAEIIAALNVMTIENSEDYEQLELIDGLTDALRKNADGNVACAAMINLLERHPHVEFGSPGEPVHTIESFRGNYEDILMESLDRHPTQMTVWMLNRMINVAAGENRDKLIEKLKACMIHPLLDVPAREMASDFYKHQLEK